MQITAITQQIKNPERASIFIDGKYCFSLTLDELLQERLHRGQQLDEPRLLLLQKKSEDGKLKMRVIEWLLRRPHSERELRQYLQRKKAETDMIDRLVEYMQQHRYQDDTAYARWLIELRSRKNQSTRQIVAELRSKGVPQELISDLIVDAPRSDIERLRALAAKKYQALRYRDPKQLLRYLAGKGYSFEDVKSVVEELTAGTSGSPDG